MKKRLQLPQTDSAPPALCRRSGAFRLTLTGQMPSSAHEPAPLWRKAPPSGNKTLVRLQRPARLEFELRWPDRFWEMIRSGRQTAPPRYEVALVTFRASHRSLEASRRGSESLCTAPLRTRRCSADARRLRAEVSQHLTTDLVSAASASRCPSFPAEGRV